MFDHEPSVPPQKNGLHDYVENRYRELAFLLSREGYDAVVKHLSVSPLPTFSEYDSTIPQTNTILKAQVAEVKGQTPEKVQALDALVEKINKLPDEAELQKALRELVALAT